MSTTYTKNMQHNYVNIISFYVDKRHKYVNMHLMYVYMTLNFTASQGNYLVNYDVNI